MARKYGAEIFVEYDGRTVNAKSILGLLSLGAGKGDTVTVTADGHDAHDAIGAIKHLFDCSFYEEQLDIVPV